MDCKEIRVDMRIPDEAGMKEGMRCLPIMHRWKETMPFSEEYRECMKEYFGDNLGEGSHVSLPINGACISSMKIGRNVFINSNVLVMGRGGITIEDNVLIAANAQLISNNHDPYDLQVLTCKPVLICKGAWIGAGATILPGVRVGRHAVVGAAAVVTRDIPDYAVAVGNPARVIKMLDADRFDD